MSGKITITYSDRELRGKILSVLEKYPNINFDLVFAKADNFIPSDSCIESIERQIQQIVHSYS